MSIGIMVHAPFPPIGVQHGDTGLRQSLDAGYSGAGVEQLGLPSVRPALPFAIADTAIAASLEVARSLPFLVGYVACGLPPVVLAFRSICMATRFAALVFALLGRFSCSIFPALRPVSARVGRAVASLNSHPTSARIELLVLFVISLHPIYTAKTTILEGLGLARFIAVTADNLQTLAVLLWRSSMTTSTPPASRPEAGIVPTAPVPIELISYDLSADGGAERGEAGGVCVICLSGLVHGEELARLPCGHIFHEPCIRQWIKAKPSCPLRCQLAETLGRPSEVQAEHGSTAARSAP